MFALAKTTRRLGEWVAEIGLAAQHEQQRSGLFFQEKACLRYIWVGPPHKEGMDTKEVLDMAEQVQNSIEYYCLSEQMAFYLEYFSKSRVKVRSIEMAIDALVVCSEVKAKIKMIFDIALRRDTITDRVSVKELFALVLLSHRTGYTLDTNMSFDKRFCRNRRYIFPHYPHFLAPYSSNMPCPEVWMMYSSANDLARPYQALTYYLKNWDKLQNIMLTFSLITIKSLA